MKKGSLYRTKKDVILHLDEIQESDIRVDRTLKTSRKLRATWSLKACEDLRGYQEVTNWNRMGKAIHLQFGNICYVPQGSVVMYVETGKTGSYKLVCGDFIGWTTDTALLLEEIECQD